MADIYVLDSETKKIRGCVSFSPSEFSSVLNCSRLIGDVGVRLFDGATGIMEQGFIAREDIVIIH
ncbi:MAG: hypothetical protein PHN60_00080 [Candidatus Gracilibacteria bacterium]|nr:hypothetical protein [Candidatus Gracilibacteria bacterium]